MANNTYGFRSALSGFHKGDVTGYIERMASQHRSELLEYEKQVTSLQEENRALQNQLNLLMMATPLAQESAPAPAPEITPPVPEEPVSAPVEEQDLMLLELQAYRRAEAVERNANNRARKLYGQIEDLCEGALDEFLTADTAVKQTIEALLAQANSLEQIYQTLASALNTSRDKLAAMNKELCLSDDVSTEE